MANFSLLVSVYVVHTLEATAQDDALDRLEVLLTELAPSKAAALAARLTGTKRNEAYARALELTRERP